MIPGNPALDGWYKWMLVKCSVMCCTEAESLKVHDCSSGKILGQNMFPIMHRISEKHGPKLTYLSTMLTKKRRRKNLMAFWLYRQVFKALVKSSVLLCGGG